MADIQKSEVHIEGKIAKLDSAKKLIFGWASVTVKSGETVTDLQEDIMDDSWELEKMAYRYVLHSRDGGVMHQERGVARLVESMVFTPEKLEKLGLPADSMPTGWWVGYRVDDADVWARAERGEFTGFSIGGRGIRQKVNDAVQE
jgi:hypothetical protein